MPDDAMRARLARARAIVAAAGLPAQVSLKSGTVRFGMAKNAQREVLSCTHAEFDGFTDEGMIAAMRKRWAPGAAEPEPTPRFVG